MKVKNVSARPHWVGDVLIAPGEVKEIAEAYANAINKADLVEVNAAAPAPAKKPAAPKPGAPDARVVPFIATAAVRV